MATKKPARLTRRAALALGATTVTGAAALAGLLADRSEWPARRRRARAFVEAERNWSSNIARYDPVYHELANARQDPAWQAHSPLNA